VLPPLEKRPLDRQRKLRRQKALPIFLLDEEKQKAKVNLVF
jgi:hypothetical protein